MVIQEKSMAIQESSDVYYFAIDAIASFHYIIRTTLFDKDNEIVFSCSEYPLAKRIKKGLYTIRLDANGIVKDTVILIDSDSEYLIKDKGCEGEQNVLVPTGIYSAAPLNEKIAESSLDYYMEPAIKYASISTGATSFERQNSSLFLFFRYHDRERYQLLKNNNKTTCMTQFRLLDHSGEKLLEFSPGENIEIDEENGWVAFNARLHAGFYLLEYTGGEKRQVPVYLLEEYHTQLFLFLDEQPVFSSLRIFIQRERSFDPYDRQYIYTDLLYNRIQQKNAFVEDGLSAEIRTGKLPAFMLHLLYAYISVASRRETVMQLYEVIMQDVYCYRSYFEGPFPDWLAIGTIDGYNDWQFRPVVGVPLINIGYQAIKKAAALPANKALVTANSLNDLIAVSALSDSPITTFIPITERFKDFYKPKIQIWEQIAHTFNLTEEQRFREKFEAEMKMIDNFLIAYHSGTSNWLEYLIYELITKEYVYSLELLSQKLQMSIVTVERTIKEVVERHFRKVTHDNVYNELYTKHTPEDMQAIETMYYDKIY